MATGHQLSSNYGGQIMKSNRFVDNLPIYDLCLRSVTYKSRGGKGGVHHGILKYDQLCKIHLWVLSIKLFSTYCQHLRHRCN